MKRFTNPIMAFQFQHKSINKYHFITSLIIYLLLNGSFALCQTNNFGCASVFQDISTWPTPGYAGNARWKFDGGTKSTINVNGIPVTIDKYVKSDHPDREMWRVDLYDVIDVEITGTMHAYDGSDADWMGFVLGYQGPFDTLNYSDSIDCDFLLFDWKQANEHSSNCPGMSCAEEGYTLSKFNGKLDHSNSSTDPLSNKSAFFYHNPNPPVFDTIATRYGSSEGWADHVVNDFKVIYTRSKTIIIVNNDTIFNISGTFEPGRFGIYNANQDNIRYGAIQYRFIKDFEVAQPVICNGATANFNYLATDEMNFNYPLINNMVWMYGDGNSDTVFFPTSSNINTTHTYTTSGIYNVMLVIEYSSGCMDIAFNTITVSDFDLDEDVVSHPLCFGDTSGTIDILVTGGTSPYTYIWSTGESTEDLSNLGAGIYSVVVNDDNQCADTLSVTIIEPPLLEPSTMVDSNASCFGYNDGAATVSVIGGTPVYTYMWSNGSTSSSNSILAAGTYTITVTDENGCYDTSNVIIEEPAGLVITETTTDALCLGANNGTVSLSITGGTGPFFTDWNGIDTNALGAGTYPYTVTDANGCQVLDSIIINDPDPLSIDTLITNVSCYDYSDGSIDLTVINGTAPYTFYWSNGDTTEDLSSLSEGIYGLTLTDNNGCQNLISVSVQQPSLFEVNILGDTSVCFGSSLILTADNGDDFIWSTGETSLSIDINPGVNTSIWITAFENGCPDDDTISITVNPLPTVFAGNDTSITNGTILALNGIATGSYNWMPEELFTCSDCPDPSVSPTQDTTYYLQTIDDNGCIALDSIRVVLIAPDVFVANIFSPNGDGRNDDLMVLGAKSNNFRFAVFDRWGTLIFESNNAMNGWDGTFRGKPVSPGVYVYTYDYLDNSGYEVSGHGDVTVVR